MKIDLALILTSAAAVTGLIWLVDSLLFARKRRLMMAEGEEVTVPVVVIHAPREVKPEITLPAPAAVPPMVTLVDEDSTIKP